MAAAEVGGVERAVFVVATTGEEEGPPVAIAVSEEAMTGDEFGWVVATLVVVSGW